MYQPYDNGKTGKKSDKFCRICFCTPSGTSCLLDEKRQLCILIRHGVTDWNAEMRLQGREDIPLNREGIIQAEKCAAELADSLGSHGIPFGIFSSPLSRAIDTAKIISEKLNSAEVSIKDGLIERDYADITGMTVEQKRKFSKKLYDNNNIETIADSAERMKRTLGEIRTENPDQKIMLAVTHGGIINALFSYLTGRRAGTRTAIAANCTYSLLALGKKDIIPIAFNLNKEMLDEYLEYYR